MNYGQFLNKVKYILSILLFNGNELWQETYAENILMKSLKDGNKS